MIRRIELHNFATHVDTEIELDNGKNVIIGPTGSGKTNLLLAVDFAFLGEVTGINLSELIADDADVAEIILDYIEPRTGQIYRIQRILTRETDGHVNHECSFRNLYTNEEVEKPMPVQKTLENLGVIPSIFRNVIHVAQGRFADLLDETQERKNSLDRLFRISQLENAYQELGRQNGPIHQIELRIHQNLEKSSSLEVVASKLSEERSALSRLTMERQKKQMKLNDMKGEHDRIDKILQRSSKIQTALNEVDKKIQKSEETVAVCNRQIQMITSHLSKLLFIDDYKKIEKVDSEKTMNYLQTIKSKLKALLEEESMQRQYYKKAFEQFSKIQSQINLVKEERKKRFNQLSNIQKYLDGKGEQPQIECDRCGSILSKEQWDKHLGEEKVKLKTLERRIEELLEKAKSQRSIADQYEQELEKNANNIKKLENLVPQIEQLTKDRRKLEETSSSKIPQIEQKKKLMNELRQLLEVDLTLKDEEVVKQALMLHERLTNLSKWIQDLKEDLTSYDENYIRPQEKRVAGAEEAADQLEKIKPEIKLDKKKINLLHMVRNSLREIQPTVRRGYVSKITLSANDYLKRLYDGEEIEDFELTKDYEFIVTRAGHKRHANRLSGGQQVLTSMAFLLALSEVLSQLDFLILDEPTTHLDWNRRNELVAVLENLRRVPQLIIVDHHPELFEAADKRFEVSLTFEGTSQLNQIYA